MTEPGIVVLGLHWHEQNNELTYVTRSIAAAVSRFDRLAVLAPGPPDRTSPDGAFDVLGVGLPGAFHWPEKIGGECSVIVDELSSEVVDLLSKMAPRDVLYLWAGTEDHDPSWRRVPLVPAGEGGRHFVKVYVPVNPSAGLHRHHGFGFTGYILVLSDRVGPHEDPPAAAAWLSAAFHDREVVVVENARASAWKGRALRGTASVDTRMDLWRLLAHADVCVDLGPGAHIARECVESMRSGTPILVPDGSGIALSHADAGGAAFASPEDLLAAVAHFGREDVRSVLSCRAREYADANFGSPSRLVASVRDLLERSET